MEKLELLKEAYRAADKDGKKYLAQINQLKVSGKDLKDPVFIESMILTMRMNAMTEVKRQLAREIGWEVMHV